MEWLFGKSKTDEELLREYELFLKRTIRDITREKARLEKKEKNLGVDVKNKARNKNYIAAKIGAKNIILIRRNIKKLYETEGKLEEISIQIMTLKSQQAIAKSFKDVSRVMSKINKKNSLRETQKIIENFNKEKMALDLKEEMILENLSDEDDLEDSEEIVNKIFDELGIELEQKLSNVPTHKISDDANTVSNDIEKQKALSDLLLFQRFDQLSQ